MSSHPSFAPPAVNPLLLLSKIWSRTQTSSTVNDYSNGRPCLFRSFTRNPICNRLELPQLIAPVVMSEGLRFALREGGRTVGAGVVAKIIE